MQVRANINPYYEFVQKHCPNHSNYVSLIQALHELVKNINSNSSDLNVPKLIEYCYEHYLYNLAVPPHARTEQQITQQKESLPLLQSLMRDYLADFEKFLAFISNLYSHNRAIYWFWENVLGWKHIASFLNQENLTFLMVENVTKNRTWLTRKFAFDVFAFIRTAPKSNLSSLELKAETYYSIINGYYDDGINYNAYKISDYKRYASRIYELLTANEKTALVAYVKNIYGNSLDKKNIFYNNLYKTFHKEENPNHPLYPLIQRAQEISRQYYEKKTHTTFTFFTHQSHIRHFTNLSEKALFTSWSGQYLTDETAEQETKDLIKLFHDEFCALFGKKTLAENPDFVVDYLRDQNNHHYRRALAQALLAIYTCPELQSYLTEKPYLAIVKRILPQQDVIYSTLGHPLLNQIKTAMDIGDVINANPAAGLNFICQLGSRIVDFVQHVSQIKMLLKALPEEDRFAFFQEYIAAKSSHCEIEGYDAELDNIVSTLFANESNAVMLEIFQCFSLKDKEEFSNTYFKFSRTVLDPYLIKHNFERDYYYRRNHPLYYIMLRAIELCDVYGEDSVTHGSVMQANASAMFAMRDDLFKKMKEFACHTFTDVTLAREKGAAVFKEALRGIEENFQTRVNKWKKDHATWFGGEDEDDRMIKAMNEPGKRHIDRSLRLMANFLYLIYHDLSEYLTEFAIVAAHKAIVDKIPFVRKFSNIHEVTYLEKHAVSSSGYLAFNLFAPSSNSSNQPFNADAVDVELTRIKLEV